MEDFKIWCKENIKQPGHFIDLDKNDIIVKKLLEELNFLYKIDKLSVTYFTRDNCSQKYIKNISSEIIFNIGEKEIMTLDGTTRMVNKNAILNLPPGGTLVVEKNIKQNRNHKNFFIRPRNYFRIFLLIQLTQNSEQNSEQSKIELKFNDENNDFYDEIEELY